MSCVDENTVAAWFERRLSQDQARGVEDHAADCTACRRLLATLSPLFAPAGEPANAPEEAKYRIVRAVGRGGMGIVYEAAHAQLGTRIALKVMLPELATAPDGVSRFLREARAAARLDSEHVARVTDVGTLASGAPYLAMEFLEGVDLARTLRDRGALPVAEAVDLVLQALEGLAHAHAQGIVHRDLKPANLFVARRRDGSACVKVLDFGISKANAALDAPPDPLTKTDALLGSPHYMSPEQLRSSKSADARSDIWSMGVVLYQLVTDSLPFGGETIGELLFAIVEQPAPSAREKRKDVPARLDAIIARCLIRDVRARWANVGDLALALAPYGTEAAGASAERVACALPASAGSATRRARTRRTATWLAVTTIGLATIAAAGVLARSPGRSEIGPRASALPPASEPAIAQLPPVSSKAELVIAAETSVPAAPRSTPPPAARKPSPRALPPTARDTPSNLPSAAPIPTSYDPAEDTRRH
jgi:serine/threonine-protein kinase